MKKDRVRVSIRWWKTKQMGFSLHNEFGQKFWQNN